MTLFEYPVTFDTNFADLSSHMDLIFSTTSIGESFLKLSISCIYILLIGNFQSVWMSIGRLSPRHGYNFKDSTTVWSSPDDKKCLPLCVSVLKIFNLPKPEV